jgi:hypothetical protein
MGRGVYVWGRQEFSNHGLVRHGGIRQRREQRDDCRKNNNPKRVMESLTIIMVGSRIFIIEEAQFQAIELEEIAIASAEVALSLLKSALNPARDVL